MQRKYRLRRETAYQEGLTSWVALCDEPTFRDFVCLYLAEGYKRDRNTVSLGNSDPAIVRLAHLWITRFTSNRVAYGIQFHADQDLADLRRFWSDELKIDPALIKFQRKSNSNQLAKRTWRCRHGVLTVRVGDTLLHARMQAWMDLLRASWV